jgi:hypothetical protein
MRTVRLAYRDVDRTPVIYCIKEIARKHYGVDVEVLLIQCKEDYEESIFDGVADVLIEHLEYLYERAAAGAKITFFTAPSKGGGRDLVVPDHVKTLDDLRGKTLAIRDSGQPDAILLWLKMMGLYDDVKTILVKDSDVGRWCQWKKVVSGECAATFMSPLYLPTALAAGLKLLAAPPIPIIGHFAQGCLSSFATENPALLKDFVRASIHGVCLMIFDRAEALKIASDEPMKLMKISDKAEFERQFDAIASQLTPKPYPTLQAVANTYEISTMRFPKAVGLNPMALWNLSWVKELDDEGFIDALMPKDHQ